MYKQITTCQKRSNRTNFFTNIYIWVFWKDKKFKYIIIISGKICTYIIFYEIFNYIIIKYICLKICFTYFFQQ